MSTKTKKVHTPFDELSIQEKHEQQRKKVDVLLHRAVHTILSMEDLIQSSEPPDPVSYHNHYKCTLRSAIESIRCATYLLGYSASPLHFHDISSPSKSKQ